MKSLAKQLFSFILPFTALVVVPLCIERNLTFRNPAAWIAGLLVVLTGLFVMINCISMFIRIGKGTLAPWSPAKRLVISGFYRYVRNPMILGVLLVLAGESLALLSLNILIWAVIFFVLNTVFFMVYEEPGLEKRFGEEYKIYKRNVSRWIPRLHPYY